MKLRSVKFYQAVTMHDGQRYRTITHLNAEKPEVAGNVEMSILEGVGVLIKTDHDTTIVTLNNVAYMHPYEEKQKVTAKKA